MRKIIDKNRTDKNDKDQEYESVRHRIKRFREKHSAQSGWRIVTGAEHSTGSGSFIFTAKIINPDNAVIASGTVVQTGASSLNYESFAVGRALYYAGFGKGEIMTSDELEVQKLLMTPGELFREKRKHVKELKTIMKIKSEIMNEENQTESSKPAGLNKNNPSQEINALSELHSPVFGVPSLNPADYNLPSNLGLRLQTENGFVIVRECRNGVIYNNRRILKDNGFTFNGQTRTWSHPVIFAT
ncbi:Uncharacterized protein dnl_06630 [Desulfonema limicola]|uniref:Uncharacterized protein n=1 Tax=Desulfonema limicola TaxID=45656 RepID=A0A975B457_9BACT|nr:hypothetical protein [Desulfonema limicola]QTA78441.1 Uncharacterized protein dnl_06630 [Desulfonema limicola]